MQIRKAFVALLGVALIGGAFAVVQPASAETDSFDSWIEEDDPAPFTTVGGLVFYKAASINFGHRASGTELTPLTDLKDLSGLAYTVKDSTNYAPSYQIGISGGVHNVTYARLVWEPYHQTPDLDIKTGVYTDLQKGSWWGANVFTTGGKITPFDGAPGSQSDPQPLDFFVDYFGDDAKVSFFGVKQGTTSEITSTVTHLEFGGKNVPLGDVDPTPYDSADISAATGPLQTKLDDANTELGKVKDELNQTKSALDAASSTTTANQAMVTALRNSLYFEQAHRGAISGTKRVGKTVTAKLVHAVPGATTKYRWSVGGKTLTKATKAKLKLRKSFAGKQLVVRITTTWIDAAGISHTAKTTAKYRRVAAIKR